MPEGIQVINDSGILQIDSTYRNLCLKTAGVAVTSTLSTEIPASYIDVSISNSVAPLLGFTATTEGVTCTVISVVGSTVVFRIFSQGAVGTSIPYYVFDVPDGTGSNFGMQVYNASGQLCFDAAKKYMRILDFYHHIPYPTTVTNTYPGKSIALIPTAYHRGIVGVIPIAPPRYMWTVAWGKVTGSSQVDLFWEAPFPRLQTDTNTGGNPYNGWLVVNMTNY